MRRLTRMACAGVVVLVAASPVSAQDERGFVRGLAGVTFGNVQTSSIFAGGGGISIGRSGFQIIGEFGRIQNVLPNEFDDAFDDLELLLELDSGLDFEIDATAPAFYGAGGVRYTFPVMGRLRPFIEALLGVAHVSIDPEFSIDGIDFTDELEDELGNEDSTNEFMMAFGGGLAIGISDGVGIDVAYRYHGITTDDPMVHASAVYAGLRIIFR